MFVLLDKMVAIDVKTVTSVIVVITVISKSIMAVLVIEVGT